MVNCIILQDICVYCQRKYLFPSILTNQREITSHYVNQITNTERKILPWKEIEQTQMAQYPSDDVTSA